MKKLLKTPIFSQAKVVLALIVTMAVVMTGCGKDKDVSDNGNLIAGNVDGSDTQNVPNAMDEDSGADASGSGDVTNVTDVTDITDVADATDGTKDTEISEADKEDAKDGESNVDSQTPNQNADTSKNETDKSQSDKSQGGSAGTTDTSSKNPDTQSGQNSGSSPSGNTGGNASQGTSGNTTKPNTGGNTGNSGSQTPAQGGNNTPHTCSFDAGKVTTAATCTKEGVKTYTCSCGKTKTESIPKTTHNYTTQTTVASCTEGGVEKTLCSICGDVKSETTVAAKGHVSSGQKYYPWGAPSCTQKGRYYYVCAVCGYAFGEEGVDPALPHTLVTVVTREPTCSSIGVAKVHCSVCGTDYDDGSTPKLGYVDIPATGNHTWITKMYPTGDVNLETGEWVYVPIEVCSVCNKAKNGEW